MSREITPAGTVWHEDRLPLPGLYPVLAMQANVTTHTKTGQSKFVMSIREPNEKSEIVRVFMDLQDTPGVLVAARTNIEAFLRDMDDLGGGRGI